MLIIGIAGKKGAGKDAIYSLICARHADSIRIAFGDAVKEDICRMLMIPLAELEANKELYRPFLQWYGTDYMRKKFGEDIWVRRWYGKVCQTTAQVVIAPDVRFRNEMDMIHDSGGFVFQVTRPSLVTNDNHSSETALDDCKDFDRHILNGGSLKQLEVEVDVALEMLGFHKPTTTK